jgi:hypothetical protein
MSKYPPPYPTTAPTRPPPQVPPVPPGQPLHTVHALDPVTLVPLYLPLEWPSPPPPPTLTSATPSSGTPGSATTLAGTNLSNVTTIIWLTSSDVEIGTPSTSFTIVSDTQIDTIFNGPRQMGGHVAVVDSAGQQSNSVTGFNMGS